MLLRIVDIFVLLAFILPLPIIVYLQGELFYIWDYLGTFAEDEPSSVSYDFIVVGAGSAGAVVANRLSKNNKVLLLDAGGDPLCYSYIPVFALEMLNRPRTAWRYKTVPQKYSQFAMDKQQSIWPRGKVLGGSSVLNYMLYVRGHPLDYETWAIATGDKSWGYEGVLPHFKRSLLYNGDYQDDERNYGTTPYGFLNVEGKNFTGNKLYKVVKDALQEVGISETDLNAPQKSGFGPFETTTKRGSRHSTFSAFLEPILGRENLRILRYSFVTKIKVDSNQNARGVWFTRHGKTYFAEASKEIIISAGAVDSPKLLMLSGIGPKEHLTKVGIKPKVDLPVGKSLKDHIGMFYTPFLIDAPLTIHPENDFGAKTFYDYFVHGKGHLTHPSLLHSQAFITTSVAKKQRKIDWPDIQLYFGYAGIYDAISEDLRKLTGTNPEAFEKYIGPYKGRHGLSIGVVLVRPKSVGEIKLGSKDPNTDPIINPRYLEHPDDAKAVVEGMKFVRNLMEKTKPFQEINATSGTIKWPGCEQHELRSDAYLDCYVRHLSFTIYHPVSTCKMGRAQGDPTAVVDPQLRVLKVKGLRVADASIMPEIVNGNTNAPTIMIGEKAADMIRQYWLDQYLISDKHTFTFRHKLYRTQCFYSRRV